MINNKESFPQKATYWLGVVTIGLLVGLSLQFVRAWTEPTLAPPNGNVGAPINTSWNPQSKAGNLAVNALGISGHGAALQIPNGSVGIGTATPNSVKQNIIDVKDAWIRDANGGAGAWASAAGGGGGASSSVPLKGSFSGNYKFTAPTGDTPISFTINAKTCGAGNGAGLLEARWLDGATVVKDWTMISGNNWNWGPDGGSGMCDASLSTIPFVGRSNAIEFRGGGNSGYSADAISYSYSGSSTLVTCSDGTLLGAMSYETGWSACGPVTSDCSGPPYYGCAEWTSIQGTQTISRYICQADGTLKPVTATQNCWFWGMICRDPNMYCVGG